MALQVARTRTKPVRHGRWRAAAVTLSNGTALVVVGLAGPAAPPPGAGATGVTAPGAAAGGTQAPLGQAVDRPVERAA